MSKKYAVLSAVKEYKKRNQGNTPTYRWIMDECGMASTSGVVYHIDRLIEDGELKRGKDNRNDLIVVGGQWSYA